ncbi:MAG: 4-hydroxy-2-oxovalerate aldolase [Patescibacteria group bacterium]
MKPTISIIDSTLRDGSHALRHQLSADAITAYCKRAETARVPILMVGHGNGLGASSLQLGKALLSDREMMIAARAGLRSTKLGAFLLPGYGTIQDDVEPVLDLGVQVLMVASHCTEANITRQHIEYAVGKGVVTYGVLMMIHRVSSEELLVQARMMQSYGASAIILMDSAGALLPHEVAVRVRALTQGLTIDVGFHAHNNLGMAIANSVAAVEAGAKIIDGTTRGLGAGAGNCQLEVIVAVLQKMGYRTDLDFYPLMDAGDFVTANIMTKPQEIGSIELMSGLAGVFSGFAPHVRKAAAQFNVDPRDIFMELGKRNVVAGQEDMIIDVAAELAKRSA